jgi:lipoprotein-anchoring transpeptidase ErfK/SrfK
MSGQAVRHPLFLALLLGCLLLPSCSTFGPSTAPKGKDKANKMIVSVKDQKMLLVTNGVPVKSYPISTSKFGIGDKPGSNCTPLGHMKVVNKIGGSAKLGTVFKSRKKTGEVLKPNAPGRDPIVTRILWLKGLEGRNRNAYHRLIYIHGTTEEKKLGRPASYGCIRMASRDVADLYNRVGYDADVFIIKGPIYVQEPNAATALLSRLTGRDEG